MEYSPPPLFKQGASAKAKVVFFAFLAIFLLVVDARLKSLTLVRQALGTVLYPLQMVAIMPRDAISRAGEYVVSNTVLENENKRLKQQEISNASVLQRVAQLNYENAYLRRILDIRAQTQTKSVLAEIIYDARDPFTRKIIIDRGIQHGVALSQPVIDDKGVVGQVTRVFPMTAEVTLLTDKNQAIPVQVARNGLRSVVYGRGQSGYLDMRTTANADIQNGDLLVTSGIDGVYPAGLSVAKVVRVENKSTTTFETNLCAPTAGIESNKQLLVLLVDTNRLPRPDTEEVKSKKEKINRRVTRDSPLKEADAPESEAAKAVKPTGVNDKAAEVKP